jgi:hypothetical protein
MAGNEDRPRGRVRFALILVASVAASWAGVTHLGVAIDDHVRLVSRTPALLQDIRFTRVQRDGTAEYPGFVPAGRILVLTDFEYVASNDLAGRSARCPVYREHGLVNPVLIPVIVLGGIAGTRSTFNPIVSHVSLTGGVIVDSHDALVANGVEGGGENARLTLMGYLVDAPTR